jgi:hypothetical protein
MGCLLSVLLLTLVPVASAQKPTAADVPALITKLKDKDEKVRTQAAKYLELLGTRPEPPSPPSSKRSETRAASSATTPSGRSAPSRGTGATRLPSSTS